MSRGGRAVSVIVPTLGLRERAGLLEAALASIREQAGVAARSIVVLNGTRACPDVERRLETDPAVRLIRRADADLPAALRAGREAVDAPFFTALDDDDLLMPGALGRRLDVLEEDESLDVVVTNGMCRNGSRESVHVGPDFDIEADPLRSLLQNNWLLPGSWLCRTDRVGADLFDGMPRYLECTYLAARFGTTYRLAWLAEPTVVYRMGSPHAESESADYVAGQARALERIAALDLPPDVRRGFERKIAGAYHTASEHALRAGRRRAAWRWHLASLLQAGGWRHLAYTRHLVLPGPGRAV